MHQSLDETPYWQSFLPEGPLVPDMELPDRCDIAVIGGGFTGLSTAIHLAKAGADVAVFEQGRLGSGASTRNGGQTLAGLKLSPAQLIKKYGLSKGRQFYEASLDAIDYLEGFFEEEGIDCDFKRRGGLWAAFTPGHFEELKGSQALLRETFDHETHLVEKSDLRSELGSDIYHGGLVDPISGGLNSGKYVAGLVTTALKYEVRLYENTEIVGVTRADGGFRVSTKDNEMMAAQVAVATNAFTPGHLKGLLRRIIPIGSSIITTEPLDEGLARTLIPKGRMVFDTKKYLNYFRITEDNRMLFGGRASLAELSAQETAAVIRQSMVRVFPELEKVRIERSSNCNVGFTFDQMPHIGMHEGLHYAMGFCGHGVANGFYFGSRLARLMQGKLQDFPFVDLKFPTIPFYREKAWFLPITGYAYQLKDKFAR